MGNIPGSTTQSSDRCVLQGLWWVLQQLTMSVCMSTHTDLCVCVCVYVVCGPPSVLVVTRQNSFLVAQILRQEKNIAVINFDTSPIAKQDKMTQGFPHLSLNCCLSWRFFHKRAFDLYLNLSSIGKSIISLASHLNC